MKNFTWKKWITYTILFFIIQLVVTIIWNYIESKDSISSAFDKEELVKVIILSILGGSLFAVWIVHKKRE